MNRIYSHKIGYILRYVLLLAIVLSTVLATVTAGAASSVEYGDIVSGLGGAYGYDVTAREITQGGHSESSVNTSRLIRNSDPPFLTSGRGQRSAPNYKLTADLTIMGAHDPIDDFEFAVFRKTASGYTRVSDIVSAHTGAIDASTNTVSGITFNVTSPEDKTDALYVMQVENGQPVPNGEANTDNLFVQYGDSAEFDPPGAVGTDAVNYIGKIDYPNKRDNIAFKIMQEGDGEMATEGYDIAFGPSIGLYEKVGNRYELITSATDHDVSEVYIHQDDWTSSNSNYPYKQFSGVKYTNGAWTYQDAPVNFTFGVTDDVTSDLASAASLSRLLGAQTGGQSTVQSGVRPTENYNSTSAGPTDASGRTVSFYDVQVNSSGQVKDDSIKDTGYGSVSLSNGVPISEKEYIVFNVRVPSGVSTVYTPNLALMTENGIVRPDMWGSNSTADLSGFTRVIWNYVNEDGSPFTGTVVYSGDCGGMTLAPEADVNVSSVANAASIIGDTVTTNGVEIHQSLFGGDDKEVKTAVKMYPTGGFLFDKMSRPVTGSSSAPVAGATFEVYTGSGSGKTVWGTVTSDADGKVNFRGLRAVDASGNDIQYYLVETFPAPGYKADTTAYGPFTVTANDQEKQITFSGSNTLYNDVETGDLKISKTQQGTKKTGDDQLKFTFSVKITPANAAMAVNGMTFTGSDGKTYVSSGASNGSFVLKDSSGNEPTVGVGQTLTFADLPAGQYSVSETGVIPATAGEFQSATSNASGTIRDGATPTAAFVNTRMEHKGKLTLTKKVRPAGSGDSGEALSGVVFTIRDAAGNTVGTMHESPAGSGVYVSDDLACETQDGTKWYDTYTVYEDIPRGTYRSDGATGTVKLGTVKVYAGTTATAFSSSPVMNEYVRGVIRISKTSKTVPNNTSFSFTLTVSPDLASFRDDNSLVVKVGGTNTTLSPNGDGTFSGDITVKVGQTLTITDVPYGSFTVTEMNAGNYDTTWTFVNKGSGDSASGSGKVASGELDSANIWYAQDTNVGSNVSFNNEIDTSAEIHVKKVITGDTPSSVDPFTFTLTPVNNAPMPDGEASVTVMGAREGVFGEIKYSQAGIYQYTVTESDNGIPGYSFAGPQTVTVTVSNVNGVLSPVISYPSGGDAVVMTNTYEETAKGEITLTGSKTILGRQIKKNDVFTFTVKEGNTVVSTGTNDENGNIVFSPIYYTSTGDHTYVITEDTPADDTLLPQTESCTVKVHVSDNNDGTLSAEIVAADSEPIAFVNKYEAGYIRIVKSAEGRWVLPGVRFWLYRDEACTDLVEELVCDSIGNVTSKPLKFGTYYLVEDLPEGYHIPTDEDGIPYYEYPFEIPMWKDKYTGKIICEPVWVDNEAEKGSTKIYFLKTSLNPKPADFDEKTKFWYRLTPKTPDAPMPDFEDYLRQYTWAGYQMSFPIEISYYDLKGEPSRTFEYYITEEIPEDPIPGMTYDTQPHVVTVTASYSTVTHKMTVTTPFDKSHAVRSTNLYQENGYIKVIKNDKATNAPLADAKFEIYDSSSMTSSHLKTTLVTDSTGAQVSSPLPTGDYYIKEVSAPDGYAIDNTTIGPVTVTANHTATAPLTVTFKDSLQTAKATLRVKKILQNLTDTSTLFTFRLAPKTFGAPMPDSGTTVSVTSGQTGSFGEIAYSYADLKGAPEKTFEYEIVEVMPTNPIPGVKYDLTQYTVTVTLKYENGVLTATPSTAATPQEVTNVYEEGYVRVFKQDSENGRPLKNAKFTLYKDIDCNSTACVLTTDENGLATSPALPAGDYWIRETQIPDGYTACDTTLQMITVTADHTATSPLFLSYYNDEQKATVNFRAIKTVQGNSDLDAEFEFVLAPVNDEPMPLTGNTVTVGPDEIGIFGDIEFKYSDLAGASSKTYYYTITETEPANPVKGVQYDTTSHNVSVTIQYANGQFTASATTDNTLVEIVNVYQEGCLKVTKTDVANSATLNGAVFTVYSDAACTQQVTTLTTANNGTATSGMLPVGDYWIKETQAPTGYTIRETGAKKVTVTQANSQGNPATATFTDDRQTAKARFNVKKALKNMTDTTTGFEFTLSPKTSGAPMPETDAGKKVTVKADGVTVTFGEISFTTADLGGQTSRTFEYTVKETVPTNPISGLKYDTNDHTVSVTLTLDGRTLTASGSTDAVALTITNELQSGHIKVTKTDAKNAKNLSGAVFTVYKTAACASTDAVATLTTDTTGTAMTTEALPVGTYWVKETTAPAGYNMDNADAVEVTVSASNTTSAPATLFFTDTEKTAKAVLKAKKNFVNATDPTATFTFTLTAKDTGAPMPASGGNTVTVASGETGSFGEIEYRYSDLGGEASKTFTYVIRETVPTPGIPGVKYDTDDHEVTVTLAYTDGVLTATASSDTTVPVLTNTYESGYIKVTKVDAKDSENLSGAVFTVYSDEACTEEVLTLTTGKDGSATGETALPVGDYWIKETKAPEGYDIDDTTAHKVTVTADNTTGSPAFGGEWPDTEKKTKAKFDAAKVLTGLKDTTTDFTFTLTAVDGAPMPSSGTAVTLKAGESGSFGEIEYGYTDLGGESSRTFTYKITETVPANPIPGLKYDAEPHTVTVTLSWNATDGVLTAVSSTASAPETFTNVYEDGYLKVQKTDKDSAAPLTGAEFTVYNDEACTDTSIVAVMVTGDGGSATLAKGLPVGTYWVKETKAPAGYTVDDTDAKEVTLTGDHTSLSPYGTTWTDTVKTVKVSLPAKKTLENLTSDEEFEFVLAAVTDGAPMPASGEETITLKAGETETFGEITFRYTDLAGATAKEFTYTITETEPTTKIPGVSYDTTAHTVKLTLAWDGTDLKVTSAALTTPTEIVNSYLSGSIAVSKKDHFGTRALEGAVFTVYSDEACTHEVTTIITGANGTGASEMLPAGDYWVKETQAPDGYELDTTGSLTVTIVDEDTVIPEVLNYTDTEMETTAAFSVKKTLENITSDVDFVFTLTPDVTGYPMPAAGGETVTLKPGETRSFGTMRYVYSDLEGADSRTFSYTIQESMPADPIPGVDYDTAPHTVTVKLAYVDGELTATPSTGTDPVEVHNVYYDGYLKVTKVDAKDSENLSGAVFTVYSDEACTKPVTTLTTGRDGSAVNEQALPVGDYWIKETKAPTGYEIDDTSAHKVTVTKDNTTASPAFGGEWPDTEKTVKTNLKAKKVFVNVTDPTATFTFTLSPVNTGDPMPAAGGETVTVVDGETGVFGDIEYRYSDLAGATSKIITYVIREKVPTDPLPGMAYDTEDHEVTVTLSYVNDVLTATASSDTTLPVLTNEYDEGYIQVTKVDAKDSENLSGAVFTVYSDEACQNVVTTMTTGKDGSAINEKALPVGDYWIKETKAPVGYEIDDTTAHMVTVTKDNTKTSPAFGGEWPDTEKTAKASLKAKKVFANATDPAATFTFTLSAKNTGDPMPAAGGETVTVADGETGTFGEIEYGYKDLGGETTTTFTYIIRENIPATKIPGVTYDTADHEVTVTLVWADGALTATASSDTTVPVLTNTYQSGYIKVTKVDAKDSENLSGAVFTVYSDEACQNAVTTMTTGIDGSAVSDKALTVGDYWIKETKAPEGYEIDDTTAHKVTVTAGNTLTEPAFGGEWPDTEKKTEARFDAKKTVIGLTGDASTYTFTLTAVDQAPMPVAPGNKVTVGAGETGSFGTIPFGYTDLPKGEDTATFTYNVTEDAAIIPMEGMTYDTASHPVTVTLHWDSATGTLTATASTETAAVELTNLYESGHIRVTKTDAKDSSTLAGAVFTVYKTSACNAADAVATLTTTGDGTAQTAKALPVGTYWVKETKAPDGYQMDDPAAREVTVTKDHTASSPVSLSFTDTQMDAEAQFQVKKTLTNDPGSSEVFNFTLRAVTAGAPMPAQTGNKASVNAGGTASFGKIPFTYNDLNGAASRTFAYEIVEDVPAKLTPGVTYDKTPKSVTITLEYKDGTLTATPSTLTAPAEVVNAYHHGYVKVTKTDAEDTSKMLSGAQFAIYSDKDCTVVEQVLTTTYEGIALSDPLPVGQYWIRETKAPVGYTVDDSEAHSITITADHTATAPLSLSYTDHKQDATATLRVAKKLVGITDTNATFTFTLSSSAARQPMPATDQCEVTIHAGETGSFGEITFDYDDLGGETSRPLTYIIRESAPADPIPGVTYDTDDHEVTVTLADIGGVLTATASTDTEPLAVTNTYYKGWIEVTKVDAKDSENLSGAEFTVYSDESCSDSSIVAVVITDNRGSATLDKALAVGDYWIKETKAPEGYEIDDTTAHKVTVTKDNTQSNPAFGGEWPDTEKKAKASLQVMKTLENLTDTTSDFTFTLTPKTAGAPMPATGGDSVTVKAGETGIFGEIEFGYTDLGEGVTSKKFEYQITENAPTDSIPGVTYDLTPHTVYVILTWDKQNDTLTATPSTLTAPENIVNTYLSGAVTVRKKDQDTGKNLSGAEFTVYSDLNCTVVEDTFSTTASGIGVSGNLPVGSYWIKETKAPDGYEIDDPNPRAIEVKSGVTGETLSLTFTDTEMTAQASLKAGKNFVNATDPAATFTFTLSAKTAGDPMPAAGGDTVTVANGETGTFGDIQYVYSDLEGAASKTFSYIVRETVPTDKLKGVTYDTADHEVSVTLSYENGILMATPSSDTSLPILTNEYNEGWLKVTKVDAKDSENLSGAEFTVYSDESCSDASFVTVLITDDRGSATLTEGLPVGDYWVKETKAPEGFWIDRTEALKVTLTKDHTSVAPYGSIWPDTEKTAKAGLRVEKDLVGLTNNSATFTFTLTPVNGAPMPTSGTTVTLHDGETGAFGEIEYAYSDIPKGSTEKVFTYEITESAPVDPIPGVTYDTAPHTVTVTLVWDKDADTLTATPSTKDAPEKIENIYYEGWLEVTKVDIQDGENLSGAEFTVYSDENCTDESFVTVMITDANGSATLDKALTVGDYWIKETKAPEGYEIDDTTAHKVTVTKDNTQANPAFGGEWPDTEKKAKASLRVTKTLENLDDTTTDFTFTLTPKTAGAPMPATGGDSVSIKAGAVGAFGDIEFGYTDLDEGVTSKRFEYQITEIMPTDPLSGVTYDLTPHTVYVTLTWDKANDTLIAKPSTLTVPENIVNTYQSGAVMVRKKDQATGKNLSGAEFTVYSDLNCTVVEDTFSTTASGIGFSGDLPVGSYWIKETKAPDGYEIDDPNPRAIEVKPGVTGETLSLTFTDTEMTAKAILKAEKNFVNATDPAATFTFSLSAKTVGDPMPAAGGDTVTVANGETGVFGDIQYVYSDLDGAASKTFSYIIRESVPAEKIKGVTYDTADHEVTVTLSYENGNLTATASSDTSLPILTNEYNKGWLKVTKVDAKDSENLSGAEFTVYSDESCSDASIVTVLITDDRGSATLTEGLPVGDYWVKETKAPEGFWIDRTEALKVTLTKDHTSVAPYGSIWPDTEKTAKASLRVEKDLVGLTNNSATFTFTLTPVDGAPMPTSGTTVTLHDGETGVFGEIEYAYSDIPKESTEKVFTYEITETAPANPIKGVTYDTAKHTVTVTLTWDKDADTLTATPSTKDAPEKIENNYYAGWLRVTKVDAKDSECLANAEFTVYSDESCSDESIVAVLITDDRGSATLKEGLPVGDYWVKETKAPVGYWIDRTDAEKITLTKDHTTVSPYGSVWPDTEITVKADPWVKKTLKNLSSDADFQFVITPDSADAPMPPADDRSVTLKAGETKKFGVIEYAYSDLGGASSKIFTYSINEVTPADPIPGVKYDTVAHKMTVTLTWDAASNTLKAEANTSLEDPIEITNTYGEGWLKVTKVDAKDSENLSGAEFTVYNDESCSDASVVTVLITDDRGSATLTEGLPVGDYWIKETKAPEGFWIDRTEALKVTLTTEHTSVAPYGSIWPDTEMTAKASLRVEKDLVGLTNNNATFTFTLTPVDGAPMPTSGNTVTIHDGKVGVFGEIEYAYSDIPKGSTEKVFTYQITESAPVDPIPGVTYDTTAHTVTVTLAYDKATDTLTATPSTKDAPEKVENNYYSGWLKVTKVDAKDSENLSGAEFTVYSDESCSDESIVAVLITDDRGSATLTEGLPVGDYWVKETKAPEGFWIDRTDAEKITLTKDHTSVSPYGSVWPDTEMTVPVTLWVEKELKNMDGGSNVFVYLLTAKTAGAPSPAAGKTVVTVRDGESASFGEITFAYSDLAGAAEKEFVYEITESIPANKLPGVNYDTEKHTVRVKLAWDGKTLTATTDQGTEASPVHSVNVYESGYIRIRKVKKGTDTGLEGAVFKVYSDEACQTEVDTLTSGQDGTALSKELPAGNYWVKEVTAPKGFNLDSTDPVAVTVTAAHTATAPFPVTFGNTEKTVDLTLWAKKTLQNLTGSTEEFTFALTPVTVGAPMPASGTSVTVKADESASFGKLHYTYSDLKGEAQQTFTYAITEALPANPTPGVKYDLIPRQVTVTLAYASDGTLTATANTGSETAPVEIVNAYESGYLKVTKTDATGSVNLSGAVFTVCTDEACEHPVDTLTTFADGTALSKELPAGVYWIKETQAPQGYIISETAPRKVTVTKDHTAAAPLALTFRDTEMIAQVYLYATKVLQNLTAPDATFTFRLTPVTPGAPMPAKDTVTVKAGETGAIGLITLPYTLLDGAASKTFSYELTEEVPASPLPGVTYDSGTLPVTVTLTYDGAALTATASTETAPARFVNVYEAAGAITLEGKKILKGRSLTNTDNFTFTVMESGVAVSHGKSDASGKIVFDEIVWPNISCVGEHVYTITEDDSTPPGVTADLSTKTVKVTVKDNGDGTLTGVIAPSSDEICFVNTYKAEGKVTLKALKTCLGRDLQATDVFTFRVLDETGATVATGANAPDGTVTFTDISYTEEDIGTHTYTVEEDTPADPDWLKDDTVYTVTVTVSDAGDGTLYCVVGGDADNMLFINCLDVTGRYTLKGVKGLAGRPMTAEDVFTFTVTENGKQVATGVSNENGEIFFTEILYKLTDLGRHTYVITEDPTTLPAVTVDPEVLTVVVNVTNEDGDTELEAELIKAESDEIAFSNTYHATGSLTLSGDKAMAGRALTEDDHFTFTVKEGDRTVTTGTSDGTGKIEFQPIVYTEKDVGSHTYTVTEDASPVGGVTVDGKARTVGVTVTDHGDGTLTAKLTEDSEPLSFVNHYSATSELKLEAMKYIGDMGKAPAAGETFTFTCQKEDGTVLTATTDENGVATFESITYTLADIGPHIFSIREKDGRDQAFVYDPTVYEVIVRVSDAGDGTLKLDLEKQIMNADGSSTPLDADAELCFINDRRVSISVTKQWEGGEGGDVILSLYADDELVPEKETVTDPLTGERYDRVNWKLERDGSRYTFTGLAPKNADGSLIVYSVREKGIEGYMRIYVNYGPYADRSNAVYDGGVIINRAATAFRVRKVWEGVTAGKPLPEIDLVLYCNGKEYGKKPTGPDKDGWYVWNNLPEYRDGSEASYYVVETKVPGFQTKYDNPMDPEITDRAFDGATITNTTVPKTGDGEHPLLWMILALLGTAGALTVIRRRKTKTGPADR